MMRLAVVGAIGLVACTHAREVETIPPHLMEVPVAVTTRHGHSFTARAEAAPHGIVWRTSRGDEVRWREARTVVHVDHTLGALDGAGIGLLIGVGLGSLAGASVAQRCDAPCNLSIGDGVWMGAATVGLAFALVGAAIGAIKSSRVVYRVSPSEP